MSNSIEYLDEVEGVYDFDWRGPGWYFWDEIWSHPSGPYPTESDARAALMGYAEENGLL